jgi:hypothetical protein
VALSLLDLFSNTHNVKRGKNWSFFALFARPNNLFSDRATPTLCLLLPVPASYLASAKRHG